MARSKQPEFNCWICNRPIDLKIAKTNAAGKAVHEECYVLKEALARSGQPIARPPVSWKEPS
jgi:hypothetical protein